MNAAKRPLNAILYKSGISAPQATIGGYSQSVDWSPDAELDLGLFRCPADKGFTGMHHAGWQAKGNSSYDHYGTSYAANPLFVGIPGAGQPLDSNSMYSRPQSRVPNPTNTVMYWENAARFAFFATNDITNGGEYIQTTGGASSCYWPYPEGDFVARGHHGREWQFNVAFGDGHASFIRIKGSGFVDIGDHNMPQSCQNGTCNCIIVRGLDWQLDTLPADLVDTTKVRQGQDTGAISGSSGASSDFDIVR
jgi:prepilin-type processing-associated H-X9-DG protein